MEELYFNNEWAIKLVSTPDKDWYIFKFFKKDYHILDIKTQQSILEKKKEYFWKYIPETILCKDLDWSYYIKQKFISWNVLKDVNINDLSTQTLEQLLDLINKYLLYCKNENQMIDITGYIDYWKQISLNKRRLLNFLQIYKNFLSSTNIMIDDNWNVFMVDICDSWETRTVWKFKNFCAKPFIEYTKYSLSEIIRLRQEEKPVKKSNFFEFITNYAKNSLFDCLKA